MSRSAVSRSGPTRGDVERLWVVVEPMELVVDTRKQVVDLLTVGLVDVVGAHVRCEVDEVVLVVADRLHDRVGDGGEVHGVREPSLDGVESRAERLEARGRVRDEGSLGDLGRDQRVPIAIAADPRTEAHGDADGICIDPRAAASCRYTTGMASNRLVVR